MAQLGDIQNEYVRNQIEQFIKSELNDDRVADRGCGCACGGLGTIEAQALAAAVAGKVWSAKFAARKPGGDEHR